MSATFLAAFSGDFDRGEALLPTCGRVGFGVSGANTTVEFLAFCRRFRDRRRTTEEAESKVLQGYEGCSMPMLPRSAIDVVSF